MLYLILCVLLNSILAVLLKLYSNFNVNLFQAIIFNYWVCVITGCVFIGYMPLTYQNIQQPWYPFSIIAGVGFVFVFNIFALGTQWCGINAATIANKISLVIPFICSIYLYNEPITATSVLAILMSFPAIYYSTTQANTTTKKSDINKNTFLLLVLFMSSGFLDALMKYLEYNFLHDVSQEPILTIFIFFNAGIIGSIILIILLILKKAKFAWRNVLAGIILGIPNYFSIYFFIKMLSSNFLNSAKLIPLNNICIMLCSSAFALLIVKEKLAKKQIVGLILTIIVILLLVVK